MPPIPKRTDPLIDYALSEWSRFEDTRAWRLSPKRNVYRDWEGKRVCVFRRDWDGDYGWSIADEDGPRYSPVGFATVEDAINALGEALGVGEC